MNTFIKKDTTGGGCQNPKFKPKINNEQKNTKFRTKIFKDCNTYY